MKKTLRTLGLPLLSTPLSQISLWTEWVVPRCSLLFKICKVAIYQFAICMSQILPAHRVRGLGWLVNVSKGDIRVKMENPMNGSSPPQGAVKHNPHQLLKICFKTMKILDIKIMWNLRHLVSFFFNCWVEEGDERGFQDFL